MKKVIMKNQSAFDKSGLSTKVTVIKTSSGPHAHHSPQIAAGEATLHNVKYKISCQLILLTIT